MLSHDIMEIIWNEKVKMEKLEKAEKSAKRGFPWVMKELKSVSMRDTDIIDSLENYNTFGMEDGSNIYEYVANELNLPDSQYTQEEEDDMVAEYIEENNIFPFITTNLCHNIVFVEYYKLKNSDEMLKIINRRKRSALNSIRNRKQWEFQKDKHIFRTLSIIRDRGYIDAPLEDKFYFLRPTAQYGFGGHMNTDIEGYGTMLYRLEINEEAEGGFLENKWRGIHTSRLARMLYEKSQKNMTVPDPLYVF
jgi:hypothetical protein